MNKKKLFVEIGLLSILIVLSFSNCNVITGVSENEVEQQAFQLINEHRVAMGLNLLQWDDSISRICRKHSTEMAEGIVSVGHDGFDLRVAEIKAEVPNSVVFGENVAFISGRLDPSGYLVDQWLANNEHRENIEGKYDFTGLGVARIENKEYYITQIFVRNK